MLKQRVITASVLLAVLFPALFSSSVWPFGALSLVLIGVGGWEWSRLNRSPHWAAMAWGSALAVVCAVALWWAVPMQVPVWVWWGASLLWLVGGGIGLRAGVAGWPHLWRPVRLSVGWVALGLCWLAMNAAKAQGVGFLLSIAAMVWMADVAAYFGGRTWGRRKLAVSISPGKSWEGVYAGLVGVVLLSFVWLYAEQALGGSGSLMDLVRNRFGHLALAAAAVTVALLSVMGDLLESLVKRSAGVKDSSSLLPGHGGVLDRVDALLPVFPVALALASL
jgi:phosphatidate cytidylyltransferase